MLQIKTNYYICFPIIILIGNELNNNDYLTKVIIPEGCQYIDGYAFAYSDYLADVVLPSSLPESTSSESNF